MAYLKLIFTLIFLFHVCLSADMKSLDGIIRFDSNSDSNPEMILNQTGLGIGTSPSTNLHVNGNAIVQTMNIGTSSGSSNLNLSGTISLNIETLNSDSIISDTSLVLLDSSSDNLSFSLPYAANVLGRVYYLKKTSTLNNIWVNGGANLIDNEKSLLLPSSTSLPLVKVISNGSNWSIIDSYEMETILVSENLVGWWKLDDSSGSLAYDSSGYHQHGQFQGGADFSTNVATGVLEQAIVVDGVDDYIEIDDASHLTFGDGTNDRPFSISVWMKSNDASVGSQAPLSKADTFSSGEYYFLLNSEDLYFRLVDHNSSDYIGVARSNVISDNTWYHIVGTYDGSGASTGLKLYIDGQVQTTSDSSSGPYTAMSASGITLRIGLRNDYFNGFLDDARVYSRELSASEVSKLFEAGN